MAEQTGSTSRGEQLKRVAEDSARIREDSTRWAKPYFGDPAEAEDLRAAFLGATEAASRQVDRSRAWRRDPDTASPVKDQTELPPSFRPAPRETVTPPIVEETISKDLFPKLFELGQAGVWVPYAPKINYLEADGWKSLEVDTIIPDSLTLIGAFGAGEGTTVAGNVAFRVKLKDGTEPIMVMRADDITESLKPRHFVGSYKTFKRLFDAYVYEQIAKEDRPEGAPEAEESVPEVVNETADHFPPVESPDATLLENATVETPEEAALLPPTPEINLERDKAIEGDFAPGAKWLLNYPQPGFDVGDILWRKFRLRKEADDDVLFEIIDNTHLLGPDGILRVKITKKKADEVVGEREFDVPYKMLIDIAKPEDPKARSRQYLAWVRRKSAEAGEVTPPQEVVTEITLGEALSDEKVAEYFHQGALWRPNPTLAQTTMLIYTESEPERFEVDAKDFSSVEIAEAFGSGMSRNNEVVLTATTTNGEVKSFTTSVNNLINYFVPKNMPAEGLSEWRRRLKVLRSHADGQEDIASKFKEEIPTEEPPAEARMGELVEDEVPPPPEPAKIVETDDELIPRMEKLLPETIQAFKEDFAVGNIWPQRTATDQQLIDRLRKEHSIALSAAEIIQFKITDLEPLFDPDLARIGVITQIFLGKELQRESNGDVYMKLSTFLEIATPPDTANVEIYADWVRYARLKQDRSLVGDSVTAFATVEVPKAEGLQVDSESAIAEAESIVKNADIDGQPETPDATDQADVQPAADTAAPPPEPETSDIIAGGRSEIVLPKIPISKVEAVPADISAELREILQTGAEWVPTGGEIASLSKATKAEVVSTDLLLTNRPTISLIATRRKINSATKQIESVEEATDLSLDDFLRLWKPKGIADWGEAQIASMKSWVEAEKKKQTETATPAAAIPSEPVIKESAYEADFVIKDDAMVITGIKMRLPEKAEPVNFGVGTIWHIPYHDAFVKVRIDQIKPIGSLDEITGTEEINVTLTVFVVDGDHAVERSLPWPAATIEAWAAIIRQSKEITGIE